MTGINATAVILCKLVCSARNNWRVHAAAGWLLIVVWLPATAQHGDNAPFHTDPACWDNTRIFHPGPPTEEQTNQVHLIEMPIAASMPGEPTQSPNGAYRFWVRNPDTSKPRPWSAGVIVDVERDTRSMLLFENISNPITPRWLNEKLIFLRVAWGRIVFSDLIFDVEKNTVIYHEQAVYGENAFQQSQLDCNGRCPCDPSAAGNLRTETSEPISPPPQSTTAPPSDGLMPSANPGPHALIGLLKLPSIFGPPETGGVRVAENPVPVPVYVAPEAGATKLGEPVDLREFEFKEYTYESAAAVVYAKKPGWYQIGMTDGTRPWITDGLAYLNSHWDRKIWESPTSYKGWNSRLKPVRGTKGEISADILEYKLLGESLWLKIETYHQSGCERSARRVVDRGWIPAYSKDGDLVADYYSRGC